MTCIVALEDGKGKVWMGGDAAITWGDVHSQRLSEPKVFKRDNFLIGIAGSARLNDILRYSLTIPERKSAASDKEYLVRDFIPVVRQCFKDHGFMSYKDDEEVGGYFLLGYNGKCYYVEDTFQAVGIQDGMFSIGCGRDYALGVLKMTENEYTPEYRIRKALEIAAYFSGAVCEPFTILSL